MTAQEQAYRSRLIQMAWDRYRSDVRNLVVCDPRYRSKERQAWGRLQRALKAIR